MPKHPKATRLGEVMMSFSDKINVQDYATMKSRMIVEKEDRRLLQSEESDDVAVSDSDDLEKEEIVIG